MVKYLMQSYGESVTTHFITAACSCGSSRTTGAHSASKSGLYKGLAVESQQHIL